MNKEQQPQTEAEAMKIAAESWDTPIEKNEAAAEKIDANVETKEDGAMDMEIQNESAALVKNSEAVEKALADVGGMEGLQATIQEMPEDRKMAMMKKLKDEYGEKELARRMKIRQFQKDKDAGDEALFHPLEYMNTQEVGESLARLFTTFTGMTTVAGLLTSGVGRLGLRYQNWQMNKEQRSHEKELKKLENSEE